MFFERGILKDYGLAKLSDMRDMIQKGNQKISQKSCTMHAAFYVFALEVEVLKYESILTASVTIISKHTG
ncbi:hypothetical protein, partial [Bartonella sp. AU18XJBT]|uniref:hypothetical protein n=1 Tax=Bartonella sp. AU18XJBT TaxID=3019089 RepID=UPI00235F5663